VPGQDFEVGVGMKDRDGATNGGGGNQTVDHLAHGLAAPAAPTVKSGRFLIIRRFSRNERSSGEQPSKVLEVLLIPCASQNLHADWVAGRDFAIKKRIDAVADRAARVAEELHPRRGVDKNHRTRLARISSRSPLQPDPRSCLALSRASGSAATVRNAKFTASRFVARAYRCMTAEQASSSISMLVRDIHQAYTLACNRPPTVDGVRFLALSAELLQTARRASS